MTGCIISHPSLISISWQSEPLSVDFIVWLDNILSMCSWQRTSKEPVESAKLGAAKRDDLHETTYFSCIVSSLMPLFFGQPAALNSSTLLTIAIRRRKKYTIDPPVLVHAVLHLGIFPRALRPARTVLRPARFTQRPARINIIYKM